MNDYQKFFDYCVCGNKLIPYWSGVNISRIFTEPVIDYKEYYQFQYPLFSENLLHDAKIREFNNKLLIDIGKTMGSVDIHALLDTDEFLFLCITKKPIVSYNERVGFQLKINNHGCRDTFDKVKDFLVHQLMVSSIIIEEFYSVAYKIFEENHFITFPINIIGIGKYSETDIPYAQLYITNNHNTTLGNINQISKKNALQNTLNIIKTMKLNIDLCTMKDLIEFAYSRNAFLCIYGIDIYIDKIKKFKLYFRFKDILSAEKTMDIFSEKIYGLNTMSVSHPDNIVDFIALTFVPIEKNEFVFDGVQIYQR